VTASDDGIAPRTEAAHVHAPIVMQYVKTSDDVKIAYLSVGEGPPVVFASNIFGDAHNYHRGWPSVRDVTDRLVRLGWRVVRYDHRGMGFSDRNDSSRVLKK